MNNHSPGFWKIWNMSIGFLGIQFGWSLQMANMGPIYEYLDAKPEDIPMLFLAAPLTGLIVQPIVGYLSDRTWHPVFGRRRPYFMIGAILSTVCLVMMPNSTSIWMMFGMPICSAVWMAAGLLWLLDSSINISMEPFRAYVADQLPEEKRTAGFSMQSFMIGIGASVASALPWIFHNWFGINDASSGSGIPLTVVYSFYAGAAAFFIAVFYTVVSTKEKPPADLDAFRKENRESQGFVVGIKNIFSAIRNMPKTMRQLALVQFFTWPGLFLMWFYYSPAVARNIFGAKDTGDALYSRGVEFAGLTLSFYNIITFLFAFMLPPIVMRLGRNITHALCLTAGAAGLISVAFVENPNMLYLSMTGVGIAWASILSMPYAMLSGSIPEDKIGIYMGIFNFFIVLPEIIASLTFGYIMSELLDNNRLTAVMLGGILMLLAAGLSLRVREKNS